MVIVADAGVSALGDYRERRQFRAAAGRPGAGAHKHGRDAADLRLSVPPGTVVADADTGEVIADLATPGATVVAAAGGRGGRGNARFATSIRQAPRIGELGEPGQRRRLRLELKLIADVGLVGLPNAGKSTLLAALTGAHPKIAGYPFTTLSPNLGVAELEGGRTVVVADVPGLIEGAHRGAGLGVDFLRHLERTRVLLHLVDAATGVEAAGAARATVEAELRAFSPALAAKPTLTVLTKLDLAEAAAAAAELSAAMPEAYRVSAATGAGIPELLEAAGRAVLEARHDADAATAVAEGGHRVYRQRPQRLGEVRVVAEPDGYRVLGRAVEREVAMTDLDNDEAVQRLQRRLRSAGVDAALAAAGCRPGDSVRIGEAEFSWEDDDTPDGSAG